MKKNGFVNPFRFKTRSLIWGAWMNLAIFCLLLLLVTCLTIFRLSALHTVSGYTVAAERLPKATDVTALQHMLHDQLVYEGIQANKAAKIADSLAGLCGTLIFMSSINVLYLWQAHRVLKHSED